MTLTTLLSQLKPRHPNPSFDAEHVVYVAGTGGGKTSAVRYMGLVPKQSQAVFFDPYTNYAGQSFQGQRCHGTASRAIFVKTLLQARRKGRPFKLAYIPPQGACLDELVFFSTIVWGMGSGRAPKLHVVIEELASCTQSSGKLQGKPGELLRGGRQYGLVVHSLFQRGQEVPKTVTEQSSTWWIGAVNSLTDARWLASQKGLEVAHIAALTSAKVNKVRLGQPIADYLLVREGIGNVTKGALNCQTGARLNAHAR